MFREAFDIRRILSQLEIEAGVKITPEDTLIIFDEVQEIPRALKSLKYFQENAPQYHIMAAGSLLGIALHEGTSFPVGKVDFCDMYPLTFTEFLLANEQDGLVGLLHEMDYQAVMNFKTKFVDYLKLYYYIGGMPEAVVNYTKNRDLKKVRNVQNKLLIAYENDFSNHATNELVTRIRMVWNSIPAQLARENKKFLFGLVREGARAREYETAITWLMDVGLLGAMAKLNARTMLDGDSFFEEFKGALTEQYVLQQLKTVKQSDIYYWAAENARAEVDFVVQLEDRIIPIEVKAAENLQAKSLKEFVQKYDNRNAVRTSMADFRVQDWMVNMPLYCIGTLQKYFVSLL